MPLPVVEPVVERLGIPGQLDVHTHPARLHRQGGLPQPRAHGRLRGTRVVLAAFNP
ncbi:MAG: hypothetical protein AVDCRST_MAG06-2161 [uncultured Nocardioides sp.]|uniref:Uncharacterized protein n=1 Tax=uncultured Nocardioides sp. TaxID=198441 RepID=A0A6J4NY03_9ACTN|nr:MAG: hypothetical protein AVDCRST_MAG06-2161 [uncultured Nocardioides sp.]